MTWGVVLGTGDDGVVEAAGAFDVPAVWESLPPPPPQAVRNNAQSNELKVSCFNQSLRGGN